MRRRKVLRIDDQAMEVDRLAENAPRDRADEAALDARAEERLPGALELQQCLPKRWNLSGADDPGFDLVRLSLKSVKLDRDFSVRKIQAGDLQDPQSCLRARDGCTRGGSPGIFGKFGG